MTNKTEQKLKEYVVKHHWKPPLITDIVLIDVEVHQGYSGCSCCSDPARIELVYKVKKQNKTRVTTKTHRWDIDMYDICLFFDELTA